VVKRLEVYFAKWNSLFYDLIGQKFNWWFCFSFMKLFILELFFIILLNWTIIAQTTM
jgi:hypothetical protein